MGAPPFESFFRRHHDRVLRYLLARVGPDDAADCLQDTFLAALRAYPPADASNTTGWILTIARHKAVDAHRARARRPVPHGAPTTPPALDTLPEPDLWAAVARLPDRQRDTIALRYAAALSYREIAEVIECTEDAARQSARAGLIRLREEYGDV